MLAPAAQALVPRFASAKVTLDDELLVFSREAQTLVSVRTPWAYELLCWSVDSHCVLVGARVISR